ncbi:hypothetical protein HaLaN_03774 [Haematococcus lacustris]|uniref:Uncharacterized protein n=1 Tax=Haematococcus lacustris TaxID=44745 RepID=A0A699YPB3_HAELA|nr:hypothetical protein HaLaN_03774 [Haematococcus lacustris]
MPLDCHSTGCWAGDACSGHPPATAPARLSAACARPPGCPCASWHATKAPATSQPWAPQPKRPLAPGCSCNDALPCTTLHWQ